MKDVIVMALACVRLSKMLYTDERGPAASLEHLRKLLSFNDEIAELVSCPYCISVWFGFVFTIMYFINKKFTMAVLMPFALSMVVVMYHETIDRLLPVNGKGVYYYEHSYSVG